jgi:hypothetical protein
MCLFGLVSSLPHGSLPRQRACIGGYPSRYSAGVHPGISCTYPSSTFGPVDDTAACHCVCDLQKGAQMPHGPGLMGLENVVIVLMCDTEGSCSENLAFEYKKLGIPSFGNL